jgi:hypothetical protein
MMKETMKQLPINISNFRNIAEQYGFDISKEPLLNIKLDKLVREMAKQNKVVFLIDEYDYPLLRNLDNADTAKEMQKVLGSFFSVIKSLYGFGFVQAVFITGVTKFSKTSIFSGMNNLDDITLDPKAAALLGYTKDEVEHYFGEYMQQFAQKNNLTVEATLLAIQEQYNGYRFSRENIRVFNPLSVLFCLSKQDFDNYWLETGTPSFLITLLKKQYHEIEDLDNAIMSKESLGSFDVDDLPLLTILFQTGYLTIADYYPETRLYKLDYPNTEVRSSFKKYILASIVQKTSHATTTLVTTLKQSLTNNDINLFCTTIKSMLAGIPYQIQLNNEAYYHSLFHLVLDLLGFSGQSEISTNKGRIDMMVETDKYLYIFEFKFTGSGKNALNQITKQRYYEKYLNLKKQIILVGPSFNTKNKELTFDWATKELSIGKK